jgi:hypothetical protein
MHKKSQKCYISCIHGGGTPKAISIKFGILVYTPDIINSAKFDHHNFAGLNLARVYKVPFPYAEPYSSYNGACANALPVMNRT